MSDHIQEIGESTAKYLAEMVRALECDYDRLAELRNTESGDLEQGEFEEMTELEKAAGECTSQEEARERIEEDPLSVEVRSDWHSLGGISAPAEFRILLGTGGPATQIVGELDDNGEPTSARLQVQDWGTPWTDYRGDAISQDDLLTYCRCFYFGEG